MSDEGKIEQFEAFPGEITWLGSWSAAEVGAQLVPFVEAHLGTTDGAIVRSHCTAGDPDLAVVDGKLVLPRYVRGSDAHLVWRGLENIRTACHEIVAAEFSKDEAFTPDRRARIEALGKIARTAARTLRLERVPFGAKALEKAGDQLSSLASTAGKMNPKDPAAQFGSNVAGFDDIVAAAHRAVSHVVATALFLEHDALAADGFAKRLAAQAKQATDASAATIGALSEKITLLEAKAAALLSDSEKVLNAARGAATADILAKHKDTFLGAVQTHRTASNRWLWAGAAASALLFGGLLWSAYQGPPMGLRTAGFVVAVGTRVAIGSLIATVGLWAARNYAVHRHNEILDQQRVNALGTFISLEGKASQEERMMMMAALTQCLFGMQPTSPNARATDAGIAGLSEIVAAIAKRGAQ